VHPRALASLPRATLAIACARDGYALLEAVYDSASPGWLRELPGVEGSMHQAAGHGVRDAR